MIKLPMSISLSALALMFGGLSHAEGISNSAKLDEVRKMLVSSSASEHLKGEAILDKEGAALVERSISVLEKCAPEEIGAAARSLRIMISPWARGIERSKVHNGNITLPLPQRPVDRPTQHASAKRAAETLESALKRLMERAGEKPQPGDEHAHYLVRSSFVHVCEALGEVADEAVLDRLAMILRESNDRAVCGSILGVFETYYSLPKSFRIGSTCGNSTAEELEQFRRNDLARCLNACGAMLKWHEKNKGRSVKVRLEAALGKWDTLLENYTFKNQSYYALGWEWQKLEPLIRSGRPLLPILEARNAAVEDMSIKGNYEVMRAAITGTLDEKLVRALLESENPSTKTQEAVLACEIIAAAGSTDWFDELDELQYRKYYKGAKASWTLAVCHGKEAIKSLKQAVEHDRGNSSAKYSILELEERGE